MASQVKGWAGQIEDDDGTLHALGSTAYGYCQTAAATAAKVVDMTGFKLVTGATIFVKFQYANSVANPTLNVNGTGAKPIYRYGTTRPSTNTSTNGWPAGAVLAFTYDGSGWQEHYWYNSQYTLSNQHQSNGNFTADSVIYRYQLLFHMDEDTLSPLNNADNNTGTSKTMLTTMEFDPFLPIYYYDSTTTVAANGNVAASSCHFQQGGFDLRFSFNCGDSSLTNMKNVYLKCSKQSNGKFRIASASPLTQTLPSAADGYYYILLGRAYSGYQIGLYADKPIFYHDGTALRFYTDPAKAVPFAALTGSPTDNSALNTALSAKANTADLGGMAAVDDAPSDGKEYLRKNGAWAEPSGGGGSGVPDGGTIGQVLAKRSDADGDAGWYSLRHLPSDKWYLPDGILESDVIAAYQFVNRLDEAEALLNVNDGTSYPLSKSGNVVWNVSSGFYIPAENNAGLNNPVLLNADINFYQSGFFGYSGLSNTTGRSAGGISNSNKKRGLFLRGVGSSYDNSYTVSYNNTTSTYRANTVTYAQDGVLGANWGSNTTLFYNGEILSLVSGYGAEGWGRDCIFGQVKGGYITSYYYTAIVLYSTILTTAQALELSDNIRALGGGIA